eukprot:TRINITY_DN4000_c0_g1_i1.p2 TRINITY_DN4000_c0_g1~~TRINITY_DN4000_c0_g1_i1.p2  ORF type:complete len:117 (-),score=20.29 TRINITY_DN4000_c0_g1_i1:263-613(-)
MENAKTKNEESSNARAPQPITLACFKMAGIAMLPTAEAPVKNFVAFTQLSPPLEKREEESDPIKNNRGIGRSTYIKTVSMGHQLLNNAHAKICNTIPAETIIAKSASLPECRQAIT